MIRFNLDGTKHELDEEKITFAEGRALERVTECSFGELGGEAQRGNLSVLQGFVWVAMKRTEPTLTFSDLDDRAIGDFVFEDTEDDDEGGGEPDPTGDVAEENDSATSD